MFLGSGVCDLPFRLPMYLKKNASLSEHEDALLHVYAIMLYLRPT